MNDIVTNNSVDDSDDHIAVPAGAVFYSCDTTGGGLPIDTQAATHGCIVVLPDGRTGTYLGDGMMHVDSAGVWARFTELLNGGSPPASLTTIPAPATSLDPLKHSPGRSEDGSAALSALLDQESGGTVFIDEMYSLMLSGASHGEVAAAVAHQRRVDASTPDQADELTRLRTAVADIRQLLDDPQSTILASGINAILHRWNV